MKDQAVICRDFQYCGLYLVENTVKESEFEKSNVFLAAASITATSTQSSDVGSSEVKQALPSPNKAFNSTHRKEHEPRLCSPEAIDKKRDKVGSCLFI